MKKLSILLILLLSALLFCGCWNYRSLNQMAIIAGIAIDRGEKGYEMTFEIIDLSSTTKEKGIQSKTIESTGETVFDAVRNAKKKLSDKLYFANAQVVIIGPELADTVGIFPAIDLFLRDAEGRETMNVIISKEKTAKEILLTKGIDTRVVSYALKYIVEDDNSVTASTSNNKLFQIYNILNGDGKSLVLPAFKRTVNDKEEAYEADGIAIFREDKLVGFLPAEEAKYYLFAVDEVKGGLFTFGTYGSDLNRITLEIFKSKTNRSYSYENNIIKVILKPKITAAIGQKETLRKFADGKTIEAIEKMAEEELEKRIIAVIHKVQIEYNSDIFGFGSMIDHKNPKLWDRLSPGWDESFPKVQVEVDATVDIVNSALTN